METISVESVTNTTKSLLDPEDTSSRQPLQRANSRARSNTLSPPKPSRPSILELGIPESEAIDISSSHTRSQSASSIGLNNTSGEHHTSIVNSVSAGALSSYKTTSGAAHVLPSDLVPMQESNAQRRTSSSTVSSMVTMPYSNLSNLMSNSVDPDLSKLSATPFDDALSFAYFRKTDIHPRKERQLLYALHVRKMQQASQLTDQSKAEKKKRGNAFSKLNAYLRKNKKKRTTAGLLHALTLAIHDRRSSQACQFANELTPQQVKKAPAMQKSKIFLYAAANRLEPVVQLLLEKGFLSNVNAPVFGDSNGQSFQFPSFFMVAVSFELDQIIRTMIKAKADVNGDWYGLTPLLVAAAKGNLALVHLLLEHGANANIVRSPSSHVGSNQQSLSRSPTVDRFGVCFRQIGSKIHVPDYPEPFVANKELFSFELAAACGHDDVCRLLLSKIDPKLYTFSNFCFVVQTDPELTFHFLKRGAPLSQTDAYGAGPLHLAARTGKLDQVLSLLQANVPINTPGENGWTALHEATSYFRKEICQYLVALGADVSSRNAEGQTPVDLAKRLGMSDEEIKSYFETSIDPTALARRQDAISAIYKSVNTSTEPRIVTGIALSNSLTRETTLSRKLTKSGNGSTPRKGRTSFLPKSSSSSGIQFVAAFGSSSPAQENSTIAEGAMSELDSSGSQPTRKTSKMKLFGSRK